MKSTLDKFYQLRKDWYYSDPVSYDSILYFKSVEQELKVIEIIKKHKLMNYVLKNSKCASMYHLSIDEILFLKEIFNGEQKS